MQSSKQLMLKIICSCLLVCFSATFSSCQEQKKPAAPTAKELLTLFEKNPKDCFIAEQLAGAYQAENDVLSALKYYKIAIENCSDNTLNYFQLGICYLLSGDPESGEENMNKAISLADKANDLKLKEMLETEKASWLAHQ